MTSRECLAAKICRANSKTFSATVKKWQLFRYFLHRAFSKRTIGIAHLEKRFSVPKLAKKSEVLFKFGKRPIESLTLVVTYVPIAYFHFEKMLHYEISEMLLHSFGLSALQAKSLTSALSLVITFFS